MLRMDILGNDDIVERAWTGSALNTLFLLLVETVVASGRHELTPLHMTRAAHFPSKVLVAGLAIMLFITVHD